MVSTGDQAPDSVSRQIAPCAESQLGGLLLVLQGAAHSLTADVWVPNFCVKLHRRWSEGILVWNLDVDYVRSPFVWCAWWAFEGPLQMHQIIPIASWVC